MLRLKRQHLSQCVHPVCRGLPRHGEHNIYINIVESRMPGIMITAEKILRSMYPVHNSQHLRREGLQSDAEAVHPRRTHLTELLQIQCFRVRFQCNLRIRRQAEPFPDPFHHETDPFRFQQRRRAAAEENGISHIPAPVFLPGPIDLFQDSLVIRFHHQRCREGHHTDFRISARLRQPLHRNRHIHDAASHAVGIESAVPAAGETERDMDVDAQFLFHDTPFPKNGPAAESLPASFLIIRPTCHHHTSAQR